MIIRRGHQKGGLGSRTFHPTTQGCNPRPPPSFPSKRGPQRSCGMVTVEPHGRVGIAGESQMHIYFRSGNMVADTGSGIGGHEDAHLPAPGPSQLTNCTIGTAALVYWHSIISCVALGGTYVRKRVTAARRTVVFSTTGASDASVPKHSHTSPQAGGVNHKTKRSSWSRLPCTACVQMHNAPSSLERHRGGAHRLRTPKKIFVHVYGWHNPYTPSPTPSSPPCLPPSVPPSVQCINPLKERHITIVSCTK